jgi:hypothetical protein
MVRADNRLHCIDLLYDIGSNSCHYHNRYQCSHQCCIVAWHWCISQHNLDIGLERDWLWRVLLVHWPVLQLLQRPVANHHWIRWIQCPVGLEPAVCIHSSHLSVSTHAWIHTIDPCMHDDDLLFWCALVMQMGRRYLLQSLEAVGIHALVCS